MAYAKSTSVPEERTKAEIERLVVKAGASRFATSWEMDAATILFDMKSRRVRFTVPLPKPADFEKNAAGARRGLSAARAAYEQERKRLMRSLLLAIKAKLESVESGIETFEDAFLAHIVVPGRHGMTIGEWAGEQIESVYNGKPLPPLLGTGR